ncbi:MAG TPA: TonB family protein [Verrucomicrobiota bacterium]|nr:TonB family protein [Verrucomicrobiota bacterium]
MNAAGSEISQSSSATEDSEESWSRGRWWVWILVVFAAQIGFIFALGDRKPAAVRQTVASPELTLTTMRDELLMLEDPTLFALPHANGFSGAAWMQLRRVEIAPYQWSELPQWLPMPTAQLASGISGFLQTNRIARYVPSLKIAPQLTLPEPLPTEAPPEPASTVRVEGVLAGRTLLNPPQLASQPAADLLANTVVQVIVNADGRVLSAVLMPPGSGSKEADQNALNTARVSRFEPLKPGQETSGDANSWMRGRMIFQWHTVPLPQTNAPVAVP